MKRSSMGETKPKGGRKPAATTAKKETGERTLSKAELVNRIIGKIESGLEKDQLKPTVGDVIRLLQLEKDLQEEEPKEIKISWVEPDKKDEQDNATEK